MSAIDVRARLAELAAEAAVCTACTLSEQRTQAVFADGSHEADLMFIGEGPGQHEDEQGLPFVGRAGQLLNRLLGGVGLRREDVYIANVVKCRPPGNRDPRHDEIEACKHFLADQIRLVDPKVVMELMLCWNRVRCRPPLGDDEVARTVESVIRTQLRHRGEAGQI